MAYGLYRNGEGFKLGEFEDSEDAQKLATKLNEHLFNNYSKQHKGLPRELVTRIIEPYEVKEITNDEQPNQGSNVE